MTHHTRQESDPPFEVGKKSKFITTLGYALAALGAAAISGAAYNSITKDLSGAVDRISKVEDTQAKMVNDVAVTRTKVDMILQHLERQDRQDKK